MTKPSSADLWFLGGVRGWKKALQNEHRLLMARYTRLERQNHPITEGHGRLIKLNALLIEMLETVETEAKLKRAEGTNYD